MSAVEALLETRKELETAYRKDIEAVDYLLARMGHKSASAAFVNGLGQTRPSRATDAPIKQGSLRDWVVKAWKSTQAEVSAPLVYDYAIKEGAKFNSNRDKTIQAIGGVLRRMTEEGSFRIKLQGAGRRSSTYERVVGLTEEEQEETPTEVGA